MLLPIHFKKYALNYLYFKNNIYFINTITNGVGTI